MSALRYVTDLFDAFYHGYRLYKNPANFTNAEDFRRSLEKMVSAGMSAAAAATASQNAQSGPYGTHNQQRLDEKHDRPVGDVDNAESTCQICLGNKRNVVYLPCNHSVACIKCTNTLLAQAQPCPICRQRIDNAVFYFSS